MHKGEYLKSKMKELGYSIDVIASCLDVDPSTVHRWLKKEDVPFTRMKLVADVLKLDLREDFPGTSTLYQQSPRNYEMLYLKELERNKILEEELAKYKAKEEE